MNEGPTASTPPENATRDLYDWLTGGDKARACCGISDAACREQPTNFFIHLISLWANKTGDLIASPKVVLPWLLGALGAPVWMVGMLVPIRESLALLPQLAIAGWMRAHAIRKWFWVAGAGVQGAAVAAMIGAALTLIGPSAGGAILALLVVFSLGRGVCSVAYKDVQGKTIARMRRGTLSGYAASAAGGLGVALGVVLWFVPDAEQAVVPIILLLALAGALWLFAAVIFTALREFPGPIEGGGNALRTAWKSLGLMRTKPYFGRFIAVRGLLVATALAAPYYAQLARTAGNGTIRNLAVLLAVSGLASLIAAPFWGRFADRSSRRVLMITGVTAAVLNLAVAAVAWDGLGQALGLWPFSVGYFLLAGLHAGVRLGRQTYLTDLGRVDDRAQLTAVANTSIGLVLLVGGAAIAAIGSVSTAIAVAVLALPSLAAAVLARGLPELERYA